MGYYISQVEHCEYICKLVNFGLIGYQVNSVLPQSDAWFPCIIFIFLLYEKVSWATGNDVVIFFVENWV